MTAMHGAGESISGGQVEQKKGSVNPRTDHFKLSNQGRAKELEGKSKESLGDLWGVIKKKNLCIIAVPEGERGGKLI